jgi:photosystem II stability/assembly factor-like uncharacterized protein
MKNKLFLFLVLFFICSNTFSQTGWVVYSTGTNRAIYDIYFVNANTGWAVGDSIITKSTNGGLNWVRQNYTYIVNTSLNSVRFINENTGYAAGGHHTGFYDFYYKYIYKTTNGGLNWNLIFNDQGGANSYITKIFPIDQNNLFITSAGSSNNSASGGLVKSTDGGYTFFYTYSKGEGNSIFFINANTGWVSFYYWIDVPSWIGRICKTTNGGVNWFEQYKDSVYYSSKINSIYFANQNTGYAVSKKFNGKTRFLKTTNGGTNWDSISYNHYKYNSVFFVNENTGWIGGSASTDSSCIGYTTNGGLSWTLQKKNYLAEVTNIYFINNLTGWATLYNSSNILRTTTGGVSFISNISNEIPSEYYLYQNYPNPFNPATNIKYQISKKSNVVIKIFDILGKEIATLVNEKQTQGTYEVSFDGINLPSGIYFYRITAGDFSDIKRMILLK